LCPARLQYGASEKQQKNGLEAEDSSSNAGRRAGSSNDSPGAFYTDGSAMNELLATTFILGPRHPAL
jgi:hypothetical protein